MAPEECVYGELMSPSRRGVQVQEVQFLSPSRSPSSSTAVTPVGRIGRVTKFQNCSSPVPLSPAAFFPTAKKRNPARSVSDFPHVVGGSGGHLLKVEKDCEKGLPGGKGLAPQNLRGDPFRRAKVKTELCLHFKRGKICPFGDKCNYAHGQEELKYTTLMDMERAGLADAKSYRCLACFSWVSTGACPFGQRCSNIHDPRAIGIVSSWLPHTDVPISNLPTTVNIDDLFHTYNLMEPVRVPPPRPPGSIRDHDKVDDTGIFGGVPKHTRLEVRVKLHQLLSSRYVYSPSHFFNNELCMVHSTYKVYFRHTGRVVDIQRVTRGAEGGGSEGGGDEEESHQFMHFIPPSPEADDHNMPSFVDTDDCIVYDVSFGAMGDNKVPPRMLLFNPDEVAIRSCTLQSVKRHKRQSRQGRLGPQSSSPSSTPSPYPTSDSLAKQISRAWLERTNTAATPTTEPEWVDFHHQVVQYELKVRLRAISDIEFHAQSLADLTKDYFRIMTYYRGLRVMGQIWHWPLCKGREITTDTTLVPNVDQHYEFPLTKTYDTCPYPLESIYSSFLDWNELSASAWSSPDTSLQDSNRKGLPIFRLLRSGARLPSSTEQDEDACLYSISRLLAWEGLFSPREVEEWEQVVAHYSSNNCTLFEESAKPCPVPISPSPTGSRRRGQFSPSSPPPSNRFSPRSRRVTQKASKPKAATASKARRYSHDEDEEICSIFAS